jgi:hypothetical protein
VAGPQIDLLTAYGVRGLECCWMNDSGRWSHKYHLDGRASPNESVPYSDVYYSLNVLLGLARVPPAAYGTSFDVARIFEDLCNAALKLPMRHGAWGMALWAASELGVEAPGMINDKLVALGRNMEQAIFWQAQDIGLSLTGVCAQARNDKAWLPVAKSLRNALMTGFRGPGALFRDGARGMRRHVATFATQVYAALALYHYGELFDDQDALNAANSCVRTLIALQGPDGEWPWFYSPAGDRVLDFYEVYSVHQHGMAPALLHHAVRSGVPGARAALSKGFDWIFGANAMQQSMLVPALPLIYRSQARRGLAGRRDIRLLSAAAHILTGRAPGSVPATKLRLTREMRSYEFGWLLWSFSGRTDYADLVNRPAFLPASA